MPSDPGRSHPSWSPSLRPAAEQGALQSIKQDGWRAWTGRQLIYSAAGRPGSKAQGGERGSLLRRQEARETSSLRSCRGLGQPEGAGVRCQEGLQGLGWTQPVPSPHGPRNLFPSLSLCAARPCGVSLALDAGRSSTSFLTASCLSPKRENGPSPSLHPRPLPS